MKEVSRKQFISAFSMAVVSLPFMSFKSSHLHSFADVPGMKIGYSAITWGGNDIQAVKDISSLGFKGIQLRSNVLKEYGSKPELVKGFLKQYALEFPMFSSGNANINTGDDEAVIRMHVQNAKFVKAAGGNYIQLTNSSRPKEGLPSSSDLQKYGKLINEIGKRTSDIGVQATYHNHMHQLGETPDEVEIIMDNCDDRNVKLLLDVAHYHQGGGDPTKAISNYKDRISSLHLKDVRQTEGAGSRAYTFVELGQGAVDFGGIFEALRQIKFNGWGIVELDSVPDKQKTPLQCAEISLRYLQSVNIRV
jgi:inosose dehydratase